MTNDPVQCVYWLAMGVLAGGIAAAYFMYIRYSEKISALKLTHRRNIRDWEFTFTTYRRCVRAKMRALKEENKRMKAKLATEKHRADAAVELANNAIYFSDSADYLRALYEICFQCDGAKRDHDYPYGSELFDDNGAPEVTK